MPLLQPIWPSRSFRSAVKDLLSLSPDHLKSLAEATETGFELPLDRAGEYGLSEERFSLVLAALETLYVQAKEDERGIEGLLEELSSLISQTPTEFEGLDLSQKRDLLPNLLTPRPAYDLKERRQAAQRSVLPTLDGLFLAVDLRIVENAANAGQRELFPILLARFQFDEAVQGGDTVTFQLTEEHLVDLENEITRVRRLIEWSRELTSGNRVE